MEHFPCFGTCVQKSPEACEMSTLPSILALSLPTWWTGALGRT